MTCSKCGNQHATSDHYKIRDKLSDKGFPTHPKNAYRKAHNKTDILEKEKYPKGYEKLKKLERGSNIGKHELLGKNTKDGKIEVSKKVPAPLRKEVSFHEKTENKKLRGKK